MGNVLLPYWLGCRLDDIHLIVGFHQAHKKALLVKKGHFLQMKENLH